MKYTFSKNPLFVFAGFAATLLLTAGNGAYAAVPAFAGAEGGGAAAVGGRGGRVIEVTNLNDSGDGSLRAALEASGPRTVVFRVAGIITLQSGIKIYNSNLTVAGQTAPGSGITIRLAGNVAQSAIEAFTHDIIIRYIKVRVGRGDTSLQTRSGIQFLGDCFNVMVDHVSSTWSVYDNLGTWSNNGVSHHQTFQWNISAEGMAGHSKGFNSGSDIQSNIVQMTDIDMHHNLFMSNENRNPLMKNKRFRVVNNITYNSAFWDFGFEGGVEADIIGNLIRRGPDSGSRHEMLWWSDNPQDAPPGKPSFFLWGNRGPNNPQGGNDWNMLSSTRAYAGDEGQVRGAYRRGSALPREEFPITAQPVEQLEGILLPVVGDSGRLDENGHWVPRRDAVDERLIREYQTGGGRIVAREGDAGGYPRMDAGYPNWDSDHDGMPDAFERAHGLNPLDPTDGARDSGNGYTWLERFLNGE